MSKQKNNQQPKIRKENKENKNVAQVATTIEFYPGKYEQGLPTETLTTEQLGERFKFRYITNSLEESLKKCPWFESEQAKEAGRETLSRPEENFIIHQTSKETGLGVVAKSKIKEGMIIGEYEGDIVDSTSSDPYDTFIGMNPKLTEKIREQLVQMTDPIKKRNLELRLIKLIEDVSTGSNTGIGMAKISAKNAGNFSRFFCHLTEKQPEGIKVPVKLANIRLEGNASPSKGRMCLYFRATRDIEIGDEVGWDYGPEYPWHEFGCKPLYLHRDTGAVIGAETVNKSASSMSVSSISNPALSIIDQHASSSAIPILTSQQTPSSTSLVSSSSAVLVSKREPGVESHAESLTTRPIADISNSSTSKSFAEQILAERSASNMVSAPSSSPNKIKKKAKKK
jgi:hypothetical protein